MRFFINIFRAKLKKNISRNEICVSKIINSWWRRTLDALSQNRKNVSYILIGNVGDTQLIYNQHVYVLTTLHEGLVMYIFVYNCQLSRIYEKTYLVHDECLQDVFLKCDILGNIISIKMQNFPEDAFYCNEVNEDLAK